MSHLLRIAIYDQITAATSYITLTTAPYFVLEYIPGTPGFSSTDVVSEIEDGGERILTTRRNVTETIELMIKVAGGDMTAAVTALEALEKALRMVDEWQFSQGGGKTWLEFQPQGSSAVYRSEILAGKVELENGSMSRYVLAKRILCKIILTRRYYWEGALAEIPLTVDATSRQTGGVTIKNHDDSGSGDTNRITILGTDITGVLPAPIKFEIKNNYGTGYDYTTDVFVGIDAFSTYLTAPQMVFEAEDAAYGDTGVSDANASAGYTANFSVGASLAAVGAWNIDAPENYFNRYFMMIGRFPVPAGLSGVYLKPRAYTTYNNTLFQEASEVAMSMTKYNQELGALSFPPVLWTSASYQMCLYGRRAAGAVTINMDFIQLMPMDGYRKFIPRSTGIEYNYSLVDDAIEKELYITTSGAGKRSNFVGYGRPMQLWPGRNTSVHVLVDGNTTHTIDRTSVVKISMRPRRLTL